MACVSYTAGLKDVSVGACVVRVSLDVNEIVQFSENFPTEKQCIPQNRPGKNPGNENSLCSLATCFWHGWLQIPITSNYLRFLDRWTLPVDNV